MKKALKRSDVILGIAAGATIAIIALTYVHFSAQGAIRLVAAFTFSNVAEATHAKSTSSSGTGSSKSFSGSSSSKTTSSQKAVTSGPNRAVTSRDGKVVSGGTGSRDRDRDNDRSSRTSSSRNTTTRSGTTTKRNPLDPAILARSRQLMLRGDFRGALLLLQQGRDARTGLSSQSRNQLSGQPQNNQPAAVLPDPELTIGAVPALLREGDTTTIAWSSQNARSCTVTGTNGDSWTGTNGSEETSPIMQREVYTLRCLDLRGRTAEKSTEVYILPVFQEV